MATSFLVEEEKMETVPLWVAEDPELGVNPFTERRKSNWKKVIISGWVVTLLVLVVYAKAPISIRDCLKRGSIQTEKPISYKGGPEKIQNLANHVHHDQSHLLVARQAPANTSALVCTTPKCKEYAKLVRANLSPKYKEIDPCEDFSTYACDGWRQTHDFRPEQSSISIGSIMSDTIKKVLLDIMGNSYKETAAIQGVNATFHKSNFGKMRDAYDTCMNEDGVKAYGVTPIVKLLEEFDKVYPEKGPNPTKENRDELTNAIIWLAKNNVAGLVGAGTTIRNRRKADDRAPDTVVIALGGGEINFARHYYNNTGIMGNYTKALAQMQHVLDTGKPIYEAPLPEARSKVLSVQASSVVSFENKMAQAMPERELASDIKYAYRPMPISKVQELVPEIDLIKFLKGQAPAGYEIGPNRTVILGDINFFTALPKILADSPRDTVRAYMKSRLVQTWGGRLHKNFTVPMRQLSNQLAGRDPNNVPERWRTCIGEVDSGLGIALSASYIERAFTLKDKSYGDQIIMDIKKEFSSRLHGFPWMSDNVKDLAAKKVVNIIQKIGYQTANPDTANPKQVFEWYSKLPISRNTNWFENGRSTFAFNFEKGWDELLAPVDKARWGMTAPTVNAYYNPSGNEIVFPAGIMQFPVFSSALPDYVNYGSFGAVAGHELTHGFDDHGSEYDENGVLRNWWDDTTRKNFQTKTQCFVKQYSNFTVEGLDGKPLNVNGKLTLGENIADAGGLTAAYSSWSKRDAARKNAGLPGLEEFTNDQLFFLSYATWWCGKVRKEQAANYIFTDPHSPNDKRIIGTTANSAAFREAFKCKVKQPTCELW